MRLATIVSNQSRGILVIVALLCAAGLYAAWQLPVAILPQTDFPRIVIIADNGEAPASQTLVSVTRPIEEAMNGVPGIARIKSKTARGSSEISLYFDGVSTLFRCCSWSRRGCRNSRRPCRLRRRFVTLSD